MSRLTYEFPKTLPTREPDGTGPTIADHIRNMAEEFLAVGQESGDPELIRDLFKQVHNKPNITVRVIAKAMDIVEAGRTQARNTPPDRDESSVKPFPWTWKQIGTQLGMLGRDQTLPKENRTTLKIVIAGLKDKATDDVITQLAQGAMITDGYNPKVILHSLTGALMREDMSMERVMRILVAVARDGDNGLKPTFLSIFDALRAETRALLTMVKDQQDQ